MPTITKRELLVQITDQTGLKQQHVLKVLQQFLDGIIVHLAEGRDVVLRNFGAFEVRQTKPRIGRNPQDPLKDVAIPARSVVKFKPGKEMKAQVGQLLDETPKPKSRKAPQRS